MDLLIVFLQGALPGLINDDHTLSNIGGHLPPCGFHGYSTTGATMVVYCSPQHLEGSIDSELTMGICFDCGEVGKGVYNFALSHTNGGRGLIVENDKGTIMVWLGKTTMYGTTMDSTMFKVDSGQKTPSIGIVLYLKQTMINIGLKLSTTPLKMFRMARDGRDLAQEYQAGSPGWFFFD